MSRRKSHVKNLKMNVFAEGQIYKKIELTRKFNLSDPFSDLLTKTKTKPHHFSLVHNDIPARDILVLPTREHPPKKGLTSKAGRARMLHDLANIELQAMELGLRTIVEFRDKNVSEQFSEQFIEELFQITLSESQHLEMCLIEIEKLGYKWGDWPIHTALWQATSHDDSILDRLLIVHRYLEGSGLDAGDTLIRRLKGVEIQENISTSILKCVEKINFEEIDHVYFGSKWYFEFCNLMSIDPALDYPTRMEKLRFVIPKRMEPINTDLRRKAGFTDAEIHYLKNLRLEFLEGSKGDKSK